MNLKYLFLLAPLTLATTSTSNISPRTTTTSLLDDLPTIVDGIKELLSTDTVNKLETIVNGGATLLGGDTPQNLQKLLSSDNINKLQSIIDNANTLLSGNFVNQTGELIGDALPLISDFSTIMTAVLKTA
ncbi:hypothetical protein BO94DRAFT_624717 [Aspergillus sclerotioniger CBS 115572]|uniref:Uncharacterized protein n=1 Tax=Aspergillus sclerotioniger CBS 115572 TaxID=1450535 RepID=A0A317WQT3_9EURO|nr:hypothetical protein BO94DRAFT_624717 [Aspergillus sclerotioniger CBS 115572]PWY86530.1 hypothetical protein BO94DRAFT_624717 [Aspergillus sclerotioniger CBS 115572]